jgi:hypothetical protein
MPLCDADCDECGGSGQVEKAPPPRESGPQFPATDDGRLAHELCELENLNDWEIGFCNSVADWVLAGRPLTEEQQKKVRQILKERS